MRRSGSNVLAFMPEDVRMHGPKGFIALLLALRLALGPRIPLKFFKEDWDSGFHQLPVEAMSARMCMVHARNPKTGKVLAFEPVGVGFGP